MEIKNKAKKYILYARKSTESDDRQQSSIESQISEMTRIAKQQNLNIVKEISESCSGYKRGRDGFAEMIEMIKDKQADGIICWKLSRLSRNPDDAGIIMGMIQRSEITHIKTYDKDWYPDDNAVVMYVEFGITNQFSKDLGTDTKRGLRAKAERGWFPCATLPLGYIHNPIELKKKHSDEEIINDEPIYSIIRTMLKELAEEKYSPRQVFLRAIKNGFRTRSGKVPSDSVFYRIVVNPFYYGEFEITIANEKVRYLGKHIPMITMFEHERIMKVMGRGNMVRQQKYIHAFTGLMKCGECGRGITADPAKIKFNKKGEKRIFKYYHCTKKHSSCSQTCIREEEIDRQLLEILERINIPEELVDIALEQIHEENLEKSKKRLGLVKDNQKEYADINKKLEILTEKLVSGTITDDIYKTVSKEYSSQLNAITSIMKDNQDSREDWIKRAERRLSFAQQAVKTFTYGLPEHKKEIVAELGSNIIIKDKKVIVELDPLLRLFINKPNEKDLKKIFARTDKNTDSKSTFKTFVSENSTWGGWWVLNPRPPLPQRGALTN
jgi:site-specific DNA recombinase